MTTIELNYVTINSSEFKEEKFPNVDEALKFIKKNEKSLSYYTLWEITAKIIKSSEVLK